MHLPSLCGERQGDGGQLAHPSREEDTGCSAPPQPVGRGATLRKSVKSAEVPSFAPEVTDRGVNPSSRSAARWGRPAVPLPSAPAPPAPALCWSSRGVTLPGCATDTPRSRNAAPCLPCGMAQAAEEISEKNHVTALEDLEILAWLMTREVGIFWQFFLHQ